MVEGLMPPQDRVLELCWPYVMVQNYFFRYSMDELKEIMAITRLVVITNLCVFKKLTN